MKLDNRKKSFCPSSLRKGNNVCLLKARMRKNDKAHVAFRSTVAMLEDEERQASSLIYKCWQIDEGKLKRHSKTIKPQIMLTIGVQ